MIFIFLDHECLIFECINIKVQKNNAYISNKK